MPYNPSVDSQVRQLKSFWHKSSFVYKGENENDILK